MRALLGLLAATASALLARGLRVAHVTDLHADPHYAASASPGALCHAESPRDGEQRRLAAITHAPYGQLGSACDAPIALAELAARHIGTLAPDAVLWTGDSARHDRDPKLERLEDDVYDANRVCAHLLAATTGVLPGRILPNVGNLDVYPHNLLAAPGQTPLLPNLATALSPVVAADSAVAVGLALNGSFHAPLTPNLHVLSLNTIYWAKENTLVPDCVSSDDAGSELLMWIDATVTRLTADNPNVKVVLQGHIPPTAASSNGSTISAAEIPVLAPNYKPACYVGFLQLARKWRGTLVSFHAGHVNVDTTTFVVESSSSLSAAGSQLAIVEVDALAKVTAKGRVARLDHIDLLLPIYTAPSVIPVYNPGVRLLLWDEERGVWQGWTQDWLDVERANSGTPADAVFALEYSTMTDYGLPDLSLASWTQLIRGELASCSDEDMLRRKHKKNKKKKPRKRDCRARAAGAFRKLYRRFRTVSGPAKRKHGRSTDFNAL